MLLGEILHRGSIKVDLEAVSKDEAIEELVDLLVDAHEISLALRDHVVEAVLERERSMSTGMEHGIAIPHGSSDRIDDIIAALGISRKGVPFQSIDGRPARIIVLLLLPKQRFQAHVRTLAGIAHLMGNRTFREALVNAPGVDAVVGLIEQAEDSGLDSKSYDNNR